MYNKKIMIVLKVKFLQTLSEKMTGLIGANPVYPVYFTTRWGIHTFGVLSPIDVLILDNNNRVTAVYERMKPNRFFFWNPKFERVIELPPETIKKKGISPGEKISLTE
jgi:uncharacterized membrane protein (UPF0127 family)